MIYTLANLVTIAMLAAPQADYLPVFGMTSSAFGKTYASTVLVRDIRSTPRWDSDEEDSPPITPKQALKLAKRMKDSIVKKKESAVLKLKGLAFMELQEGNLWVVTFGHVFQAGDEPQDSDSEEISIVVLMDGTVIKPVVTGAEPANKSRN